MIAFPPRCPPRALLRLPEGVRLQLARFTLWRIRQANGIKTSTLALCLAALSGLLGYWLAQPSGLSELIAMHAQPSLAAANADNVKYPDSTQAAPTAQQWGELQAEVLRLRLLFARIADLTELNGEEFKLALQLGDNRYLESLNHFDDKSEPVGESYALAKRTVDHMTSQAELMLSISQTRQKERRFTLSGSPVMRAQITSHYGFRIDPRSGRKQRHRGLDFAGTRGNKVFALADGIVTYAGKNGGYGNLVELEHANGYRTRYAHNEENLVSVGKKVSKGQVIATMGSTGKSTGTHVHVEVRLDGRPIDPIQFISVDP